MSSLSSIIHLAPSGIAKPEGASVFLNLEGKKISASPMVGTKTEVKDATLIGYSDIAAVRVRSVEDGAHLTCFLGQKRCCRLRAGI